MGANISAMIDDVVAQQTGGQGDETPSVEELRSALGSDAEGATDEELLTEYQSAVQSLDTAPDVAPEKQAAWNRSWHFLVDGAPVTDVAKLPADKLLETPIGYRAGQKDQARTLDGLVRQAQRAVLEEQRAQQVSEMYAQLSTEAEQARTELEALKEEQRFWAWIMQDPTGTRFAQAQEQFQAATFDPTPPARPTAPQSQPAQSAAQAGELVYHMRYKPAVQELSRSWSADGRAPDARAAAQLEASIEQVFRTLVAREERLIAANPQYGMQRLQQIVEADLPDMLREAGLKPVASGRESQLSAELATLKARMARQKLDRSPDGGSGSVPPVGTSGADLKDVKSFKDAMKMLQDPTQNFGL